MASPTNAIRDDKDNEPKVAPGRHEARGYCHPGLGCRSRGELLPEARVATGQSRRQAPACFSSRRTAPHAPSNSART